MRTNYDYEFWGNDDTIANYEVEDLAVNETTGTIELYLVPKTPEIKKVIFNNPATIVYWEDRSKTVVKCEKEKYDPEKGLAMAIAKKALGNKGNYFEVFKKWVGEDKLFPEKKKEKKQESKKKSSKK
nr:MAG TPA: hypothetical protein [Caudoviricetes sp.]